MYLHPDNKRPVYDTHAPEAPPFGVMSDVLDVVKDTIFKFFIWNGRVYNASTGEDTGLQRKDLINTDDPLNVPEELLEWWQMVNGVNFVPQLSYTPGGNFSASIKYSGHDGGFIRTISGHGRTPAIALQDIKDTFESYRVYYNQGRYYVFSVDTFVEITKDTAIQLLEGK